MPGEVYRADGIYPCVFINDNKIPWGMAHGHRFTVYKDMFFIDNEFGGHVNVNKTKRIINGKSTRKKTGDTNATRAIKEKRRNSKSPKGNQGHK